MNTPPKAATKVLDRRIFPPGRVVFHAGDLGDSAFLIRSGTVDIYRQDGDSEVVIAQLGPGEIFGEMALLSTGRRSTNARAATMCECVAISGGNLEKLLEGADPGVVALLRTLVRRLRELGDKVTVCPETGKLRLASEVPTTETQAGAASH
ncbi:MAG: cyclic nucleotide-binding domain-containing protein [Alphaproteobacteria bacterium]|nr:cyclic nucleotide-binding domain-containing protein [Alphaproteobacteria bacterium]